MSYEPGERNTWVQEAYQRLKKESKTCDPLYGEKVKKKQKNEPKRLITPLDQHGPDWNVNSYEGE